MRYGRIAGLFALLCVACQGSYAPGSGGSDHSAEPGAPGPAISNVKVVPNPNCVLSATLTFDTDRAATGKAHVVNTGEADADATFADNTFYSPPEAGDVTHHSIPLIGMRALSSFAITFTVTDPQGRTSTGSTTYATPKLPHGFPTFRVASNNKALTTPGYDVFNVEEFTSTPADIGPTGTGVIAVDSDMEVVWYNIGKIIEDPQKLPNGNYVGLTGKVGSLFPSWTEFDMMGNVVAAHTNTGEGVPTFSHAVAPEVIQTDAGPQVQSLLTLSTDVRSISGYGDAGQNTFNVVSSMVVEMSLDGGGPAKVVSDGFNFFDAHYEGPNAQSAGDFADNFWHNVYPDAAGGTHDWMHGNAVYPDYSDDTIISSSRSLSWIYKVRRDGTLVWKLGANGDFTLTNLGETWMYAQHGVYVTPQGTIMCFDDGNGRPLQPGEAPYSRALEFKIDEVNKLATIVWQFRDDFNANIMGSSYVTGNNVLVDDGCNIPKPKLTTADPTNLKTARVFEVTHQMPPVIVAEVDFDTPLGQFPDDPSYSGFAVYRAYKWPSLYGFY